MIVKYWATYPTNKWKTGTLLSVSPYKVIDWDWGHQTVYPDRILKFFYKIALTSTGRLFSISYIKTPMAPYLYNFNICLFGKSLTLRIGNYEYKKDQG